MPYIGNVYVPFIESQDLSKAREVVEREYVGFNPTVTEHEHHLEDGSYNFILVDNRANREDDVDLGIPYSIEEQRRGVEALTDRNAAEIPSEVHGDTGFLSVEGVSFAREPRKDSHHGSMDVRYMENSEYRPGILLEPDPAINDYGITDDAMIGIPMAMNDILARRYSDGDTTSAVRIHSIETETGQDMGIYFTTREQIIYEFPSTDFVDAERIGEVRAYRGDGTRLFGDPHEIDDVDGVQITNRTFEWDVTTGGLQYYTGGQWVNAGAVSLGLDNPFLQEMDTSHAKVTDDFGEEVYLDRGAIFLKMDIATQDSVQLDTTNADSPVQSTETIWNGSTYLGNTNAGYDFFIMRSRNLGSFSGTQTMSYDNIPTDRDVRVCLGILLDSSTDAENTTQAWCLNNLNAVRTLFDRSQL